MHSMYYYTTMTKHQVFVNVDLKQCSYCKDTEVREEARQDSMYNIVTFV